MKDIDETVDGIAVTETPAEPIPFFSLPYCRTASPYDIASWHYYNIFLSCEKLPFAIMSEDRDVDSHPSTPFISAAVEEDRDPSPEFDGRPPHLVQSNVSGADVLVVNNERGHSVFSIPFQPPPRSVEFQDLRSGRPPRVRVHAQAQDDENVGRVTEDDIRHILEEASENEESHFARAPDPRKESKTKSDLVRENEELKEKNTCLFCCARNREIMFLPCGHIAACRGCAHQLNQCPVCRKPIEERKRFFSAT